MPATKRFSAAAAFSVAALMTSLTLLSIQRAFAATLTPNAIVIAYNLASGQSTPAITPPADRPVSVMGCCTTYGTRGVGQVTIERESGQFLQWVGLNSNPSGTVTQGYSGNPGTKFLQIDFGGVVNLAIFNGDSFVVTNSSGGVRTGNVTLIY